MRKLRSWRTARALVFAVLTVSAAFSGAQAGPADMHGDAVIRSTPLPVTKSVLSNLSLATGAIGSTTLQGSYLPSCPVKPATHRIIVLQNGVQIGTGLLGAAAPGQAIPFTVQLTSKPTGHLTFALESNGRRAFAASSLDSQLLRRSPMLFGGGVPPGAVPTPTATPQFHTEIIIVEPCN